METFLSISEEGISGVERICRYTLITNDLAVSVLDAIGADFFECILPHTSSSARLISKRLSAPKYDRSIYHVSRSGSRSSGALRSCSLSLVRHGHIPSVPLCHKRIVRSL